MDTLYIEEYERIVVDPVTGDTVPLFGNFRTAHTLPVTTTSSQSVAFQPTTGFVTLTSDTDCRFAIGLSPDATSSARYLPAAQTRFLRVSAGEKIAVIGAA
jgi:hypothetical protein